MRRNSMGLFFLLAVVWAGGGCERSAPGGMTAAPAGGAGGEEIVAIVNGAPITAAALEASASGQLKQLQGQIYQVKRRTLDSMIDRMLVEKVARDQGKSPEAYLAEQVDAKVVPPSEEQIQAFYDQQKARIRAPLDQVREKIIDYLKQNRRSEEMQALTARLRKEAAVQVTLQPPRTPISLEDPAYTLGDKNAPIVLAEFSDYQCPYSKKSQEALGKVMEEYKDKIYYAFFDFPMPFHKDALKAHEAVRCAAEQGKAYPYSRKVFEDQSKLGVEDLKAVAGELGLDTKAFDACLDSGTQASKVQQSIERGRLAGVTGTPAFFINGILISGAQPVEAFQGIVKQELENKP
jgi:protein-disulfide isomerase